MRSSLPFAAALLCSLVLAGPALAWDIFSFPQAHFAAQFPSSPRMGSNSYRTTAGLDVPAERFTARKDNVAYTLTRADFSGTALEKDAAIADAVKGFGQSGQVLVDVEARINSEYGRELSLDNKDGSRSVVAIFFFDSHLYVLHGHAEPPDPRAASADLIRFQQSLTFLP
jgi:hypothetical protein